MKRMLFLVLIATAFATMVSAQTFDGALGIEILETIDDLRTFTEGDLSSTLTLISEDPEEGVERHVVRQFRRDADDKFLMLLQEPAVKLGQGYLRVDDSLWFYDPESRQFTYTSMKERFADTDARNSDFGASSLTDDYEVASIAEGTLGRFEVYILELQAKHAEVTYARQVLWVSKDPYLPLKSEDYSETGRLMRTSLYPNYTRVSGTYVATRIIFVDELVEGARTQITLDNVSAAPLPDSVFTKSYVERVNR
jgi:outer membrane lipoprotein-sorting protein